MGDTDPVRWTTVEAVEGPPAATVEAYVDRTSEEVRDADPYDAVKTIHDALARERGEEPTLPGQGETFVTAYLLEREGVIEPGGPDAGDGGRNPDPNGGEGRNGGGDGFPSVVARRPGGDRLRELFWERERTMWWIAIRLGVHWALVRYWLYEESIPLRERNFPPERMERIRAHRDREA